MPEFQRVFTDLEDLGGNILSKEKYLEIDSQAFDVPLTIASAIEFIRKRSNSKVIEPVSSKHQSLDLVSKNPNSTPNKFNEDRILLHKQLVKFLAARNRKKLESNLSLSKMVKVEKAILQNAEKHILKKREISLRTVASTRNIWLNDSHNANHLNVIEVLPSIYK